MASTWRKDSCGHSRSTHKPGLFPIRIHNDVEINEIHPTQKKVVKKLHTRKSRYYLNRDIVEDGIEEYLGP